MRVILLQALVFLASFEIFQVELILGKVLLPGFGGGYLVWGVSVVFYQGLLFLGYLYIHVMNRRLRFAQFRKWQTGLMAASLLLLPLSVERLARPEYQLPMVVEIVWMLSLTIGLLFFLLSGLSIYAQVHLSASPLPDKANPYILFAASNLGAFASLLGYPFLWEANFDIPTQIQHWQIGYALVVVLFLAVQWRIPLEEASQPLGQPLSSCPPRKVMQWLLLSAAPSAMFLSITNEITFNIAPVPLLWIIPLAIYLLTLVLSFMRRPFCPKFIQDRFFMIVGLGVVLYVFKATGNNLVEYGILFLISLRSTHYWAIMAAEPLILVMICFVFCLVCHYRLNEARPEDSGQLTTYYLVLSAGGFVGGVLVNWLVPLIFNDTLELLISFGLGALGLMALETSRRDSPIRWVGIVGGIWVLPIGWVYALNTMGPAAGMLIAGVAGSALLLLLFLLQNQARPMAIALAGLIVLVPFLDQFAAGKKTHLKSRNYYGVYKVYDTASFRRMNHGTTLHGAQYLDPQKENEPLTYFHRGSPVGEILGQRPIPVQHVALVGLGTGTLATYARPGDVYDVFELDPMVGRIAEDYFSFVPSSQGALRMVYGDARVSLHREPDARYDAVVVDVFNSGSIPVHLMTVEALQEYQRVLKPDGVVFFHITNQFLDLAPVLGANAAQLDVLTAFKSTPQGNSPEQEATSWIVVTENAAAHAVLKERGGWKDLAVDPAAKAWSDTYSSLWSALRQ